MLAQAGALRRAVRRSGRVVAVLVLTAAAVVAGAAAASAHTALVSSSPGAGTSVRAPLDAVRLTFTEDVGTPAYVAVTGPAGAVAAGAAQVRGAEVSVRLPRDLAAGRYTVGYRVVSDDGHPVEGSFAFQLTAAPAEPSATPSTAPSAGSSLPPSTAASTAPATAAAAAVTAPGDHSSHWFMGFAGVAMVVAGAGALVYERHQRGSDDDEDDNDPDRDPDRDHDGVSTAGADRGGSS